MAYTLPEIARICQRPARGLPERCQDTIALTGGSRDGQDVEAAVADLRAKGVTFEEYDLPGVKTVNGIAELGGTRGPGSRTPRATSYRWCSSRRPDREGERLRQPSAGAAVTLRPVRMPVTDPTSLFQQFILSCPLRAWPRI